MTTPQFPWQQVAQSCPEALNLWFESPRPETEKPWDEIEFAAYVGYLEAFFDGQQIVIYTEPNEPLGWAYNVFGMEFGMFKHETRQHAQIAGYVDAFEILEARLTNRPENPNDSNQTAQLA